MYMFLYCLCSGEISGSFKGTPSFANFSKLSLKGYVHCLCLGIKHKVEDQRLRPGEYVHIIKVCICTASFLYFVSQFQSCYCICNNFWMAVYIYENFQNWEEIF